MDNAFNFPVISPPPAPPSIKDEPAALEIPSSSPAAIGQQFDAYRNVYQLSPLSQMSPLSPQNRNLTPSPISMGATGGAYTEQLCNLMQDSTIQNTNCQMHEVVFNEQENHAFGYEVTYNSNNTNYNNNTNYIANNANYFGAVRNTTSGGCFERINNAGVGTPLTPLNNQSTVPQLPNFVSEKERIERIKMDLMQTPISLMQSPPQVAAVPLQNGWHENVNMDFLQ